MRSTAIESEDSIILPETKGNIIGTSALESVPEWDPQEERKLLRKIDLRIFPVLIILFILNFVDRNNFPNARLKGLEADLGLTNVEYNTCISIFLVGYITFQIPSNMFLNKIPKPSLYLCACVTVWGIISAATAATKNATGAILCRFVLGILESAFFPGCLFYLSRWYTRKEMQLRVAILNAGNVAAQGFGGLIAAGILANLDGARGVQGWRWLFIIEGALTVTCALLAMIMLPDYPATTRWLSERERFVAEKRLFNDSGLAKNNDSGTSALGGLKLAIADPKVWLFGIADLVTLVGLSFSFFFPTISAGLGFNTTITLCLTAPPWIWALLFSLPVSWNADRTGKPFYHYLGPALACILGCIISIATTKVGPRYFAMFLLTCGYVSAFVLLAWAANSIRNPAKRAPGIALVNAMGNIGSIPGSYMWPIKFGPYYQNSFAAALSMVGLACCLMFGIRMYLKNLNARMDKAEAEIGRISVDSGKAGETVITDSDQGGKRFRYYY